jgi:hypothetical protein
MLIHNQLGRRSDFRGKGTVGREFSFQIDARVTGVLRSKEARQLFQLSRLRLVNQQIGFLRFAAAVDLHGVWHGWEVSGCGER